MRFRIVTGMVALFFVSAWSLNKNQSVEFSQDLNRNASLESDAAFHNPAGLSFLPVDGWYLGGGNQTILQRRVVKEPSPLLNAYGQPEYGGDIRSWVFPTIQAAYRSGNLTVFAHGGPLGGGGSGQFDQGLPQFDNMILGFASGIGEMAKAGVDANAPAPNLTSGAVPVFKYKRDLSFTGDEMILGATAGAAYRVLPTLSVAAAYRFSYARNAYKGSAKVSELGVAYSGSAGGSAIDSAIDANANGAIQGLWKDVSVDVVATGVAHSVVLGADFKPSEIWNLGVRFEWNGELETENETKTLVAPDALVPYLAAYADGTRSKITEPMILAGGVSWKGVRNLTLESSWTFGFDEVVDRGGEEDDFHNSLFAGLGMRYQLLPSVEVSTGYAYDFAFRDDAARIETDFDLPTHFISAGVGVQASESLKLQGGLMVGLGQDAHGISKASLASQDMSSNLICIGIGVQWSPRVL